MYISGFKGKDGVIQMVKAYMDKKIEVDEFITHNMTLDQVNDAIELMQQSKWYTVHYNNVAIDDILNV